PLACATALATLAVYEDEDLINRAARMGKELTKRLQGLAERHPSVGAVRNIGLFGIVELVRSRNPYTPLAPFNGSSPEMAALGRHFREEGLYTIVRWNNFYTNPPLTITEAEMDEGFAIIEAGLAMTDRAPTARSPTRFNPDRGSRSMKWEPSMATPTTTRLDVPAEVGTITHFIDNKPYDGPTARWGDVTDPALGRVTHRVAFADEALVDQAVAVATRAAVGWRQSSLAVRTRTFFAFHALLEKHRREVAELLTREHGKVLSDAMGEVQRGIEVVEFACGLPQLLKGEFSENVSSEVDSYSIRQPLGVVAGITPFNFPAMVPMWMYPVAIACGNAFVLKPSERVRRGRSPRRRVQCRSRGQGDRRRHPEAPRHRRRQLRRLDAGGPLYL
ncbi:MAG: malonate-semialdehyde dehydrogenase (acetylating) / methylmalonate-semialdehyde dehydrogenase, partial [bacterium]